MKLKKKKKKKETTAKLKNDIKQLKRENDRNI